jgi:hypothetical protein
MEYKSYAEDIGVVEYVESCPKGCYGEIFAYGSTEIQIGWVFIRYDYSFSDDSMKHIKKQIDALIKLEKEYHQSQNKMED